MGVCQSCLCCSRNGWRRGAIDLDLRYQKFHFNEDPSRRLIFERSKYPVIKLKKVLLLKPPKETPPSPSKMAENSLVSTSGAASGLQVALHPLVLLQVSDYITRHTLRQNVGPVVGALLGQQNGREITIEHAFDCLLVEIEGEIVMSQAWFEDRLQQMKDVHKDPALELVGWYTVMPITGPQPVHLPIHRQILHSYNESAILLGFNPSEVLEGSAGGKLPLTIFESNYEADDSAGGDSGEDKEMKDGEAQLKLKFKELPYSVETGEAEMISVDFVARGGGNATAVEGTPKKSAGEARGKGKQKAEPEASENISGLDAPRDEHSYLSREEEELIATLTAKANAVKMLHARINLIAAYLQNLPPSFINNSVPEGEEDESKQHTPVNFSVLRSIQALLTRLSLLVPTDSAAFDQELLAEANDVETVNLLSTLTQSIKDVRETGRKFSVVEQGRASKNAKGGSNQVYVGWNEGGSSGNGVMGVGDLIT